MVLRNRRTRYYILAVLVTTVAFTLVYNVGMRVWEHDPQPLYRSLEVVFQTFTTTGYGEDAPWSTLQMNLLVVAMQLAGIGLILTAVDVFAVPWIRRALRVDPPTVAPDLTDHVVICEYTPRGEAFVTELESRDREYVVVESDRETAVELHEADVPVVHGDPESTVVLENAGIGAAAAVVADAADDTNASIVLSAREAAPDVRIVTLVEDDDLAQYHRVAGADEVLSPRRLLGESLAAQVPTAVSTDVAEGVTIGDDFELVELSVEAGSDLSGRSFRDARIRDRFGVTVIGAWVDGDFRTPVPPETTVTSGVRLLAAGAPDRLDDLRDATAARMRSFAPQRVVVAGAGQSGRAARELLAEAGTRLTILDVEDGPDVDVVGDARDPAVLREAGIEDATVLLLALGDDTSAVFASLIARDVNPDLDIVVRVDEGTEEEKLYRAGADYVQSLARVSGRMLATTVFEDEAVLAYHQRIRVVKLPAGDLTGRTLAGTELRETTGCTVLAVERDDRTMTQVDPHEFEFGPDDEVVLAGTDESVTTFEREFGV
jgi:Trk K+ transport system NAD-binding subunit